MAVGAVAAAEVVGTAVEGVRARVQAAEEVVAVLGMVGGKAPEHPGRKRCASKPCTGHRLNSKSGWRWTHSP